MTLPAPPHTSLLVQDPGLEETKAQKDRGVPIATPAAGGAATLDHPPPISAVHTNGHPEAGTEHLSRDSLPRAGQD